MQAAEGAEEVAAMGKVLTALVAQRREMHERMRSMPRRICGSRMLGALVLARVSANRLPCTLLLAAFSVAGAMITWTEARADQPQHAPLTWEASFTSTPPAVDGKADDVWSATEPLHVTVREAIGGGRPFSVELRALYTKETLYVLARWPDETKSDMRDPYVWNDGKKAYDRPSKPDDQFAIEFPLAGDFGISMLSMDREYVADVWHWKAGRGNSEGRVDDKRHIISRSATPNAKKYSMGGHGDIYIARLVDTGRNAYERRETPLSFEGAIVDSFVSREPVGSAADVWGKGEHDGEAWVLEMARRLDTGQADDAVIDPTTGTRCAIAVLNDELYWNHSVSAMIFLSFATDTHQRTGSSDSQEITVDFDALEAGQPPQGFSFALTGEGSPPLWVTRADPDAPSPSYVLVQTTDDPSSYRFPLSTYNGFSAKDVQLSVKFKPLSGQVDQAAGLVWRYRDSNNYYVVRANALEDNVVLYKVEDGKRRDLKPKGSWFGYGKPAEVRRSRWNSLRISARGSHFDVWLNDEHLFRVEDDTFSEPGRVGLWTKADSVTAFDDLSIKRLDAE